MAAEVGTKQGEVIKIRKEGKEWRRNEGLVSELGASVRVCGNIYCPAEVGGSDLLLISGEASELWCVCVEMVSMQGFKEYDRILGRKNGYADHLR